MAFDDARARYPDAFNRAWGLDERLLPGCESGREFYDRVASFVDELRAFEGRIIVVTHGASMECLIGRWLRLAPETVASVGFAVYPASITELTRDRFARPLLERMNDVAHLAALAPVGQS
jgi:broad specificity phosphatase PhoE